jgi:hypothetical protein
VSKMKLSPLKTCILRLRRKIRSVYRGQDEVSLLRASLAGETEAWGEIGESIESVIGRRNRGLG